MSKKVKNLIIAIVCVCLLAGSLVVVLKLTPKNPADGSSSAAPVTSTEEYPLIAQETDSVLKIVIKNETDEITFDKSEDTLTVEELKDLPLSKSTLMYFASDFAAITASKKISTEKLEDFGLADPKLSAAVTYADQSVKSFVIGDEASGSSGCYLMMADDPTVYVVPSSLGDKLKTTKLSLIDTTLVSVSATAADGSQTQAAVGDITLSGTSRPVPLEIKTLGKDDPDAAMMMASHVLVYNGNREATNPDLLSAAMQSMTSVYATGVAYIRPDAAKLKELGLDNPASIAKYAVNGTEYTIKLGTQNDEGDYYALFNDVNVVYTIGKGSLPWATWTRTDILSRLLFIASINDVKSVTIKTADIDEQFIIEGTDDAMAIKHKGKAVNLDKFKSLYQTLISTVPEAPAEQKPTGEPTFTMTFEYKDASRQKSVITMTPNGTRRLYFAVNGVGIYNVLDSAAEKIVSETKKYIESGAESNPLG